MRQPGVLFSARSKIHLVEMPLEARVLVETHLGNLAATVAHLPVEKVREMFESDEDGLRFFSVTPPWRVEFSIHGAVIFLHGVYDERRFPRPSVKSA
jgi:hypothetical protein